jgi:hypothetical protein
MRKINIYKQLFSFDDNIQLLQSRMQNRQKNLAVAKFFRQRRLPSFFICSPFRDKFLLTKKEKRHEAFSHRPYVKKGRKTFRRFSGATNRDLPFFRWIYLSDYILPLLVHNHNYYLHFLFI